MSSVNDILGNHGKGNKLSAKETKAQAEKLIAELQKEGTVPVQPQAQPSPKPRGRPPGSRSKSPGPRAPPNVEINIPPQVPPNQKTPEEVANGMKCKRLIRKLRAYKRNFPELLGKDLASVNVHLCSYEQLNQLIDSCKEVIGDEIESQCAPDFLGSLLDGAEKAAVSMAMGAEPGSGVQKLIHLRNFAQAAKADPCISMDLKLIACEWVGMIPQNPYLRLFMNLARCAGEVFVKNSQFSGVDDIASSEEFSEF